ncbi:MAG: inositol monophosphatase, partial [Armatimonadota bacterium]
MLNNRQALVDHLHRLHDQLQKALLAALTAADVESTVDDLSAVADVRGGDTIYAIDTIAEEIIDAYCEEWAAAEGPFVLISEGVEDAGWKVFPHDAHEEDARFLLIFDPIDGTRNLMFNKRSSWALSGIAPNKGRETTLVDIEVAMMTELPTSRALLADQLWAIQGEGAFRRIRN